MDDNELEMRMSQNPFEELQQQLQSKPNDLDQLRRRMRSHNKLGLVALLAMLLVVTLIGFGWLEQMNTSGADEVLGVEEEIEAEVASVSVNDLCSEKDGVVMKTTDGSYCMLGDGRKCKLDESFAQGYCVEEEVLGVQDEAEPTPTPSPTPVANEYQVYQLQITRKPDAIEPVERELKRYVAEALGLNEAEAPEAQLVSIHYDTEQGSPYEEDNKYYFDYIVAMQGEEIETPATFEDYATIMRLNRGDDELLPQLADAGYCEANEDCVVRRSYCTYGAFNQYETFVDGYSCGELQDAFGEATVFYDKQLNCKAERVYAEPVCENNTCQPSKQAARCIN